MERPGEQMRGVKGFVKQEEDSRFSPGSMGCYGKTWLINAKQQPRPSVPLAGGVVASPSPKFHHEARLSPDLLLRDQAPPPPQP